MKNLKHLTKMFVMLSILSAIFACKKDKNIVPEAQFDLNNPQGYAIVITPSDKENMPAILLFPSENKLVVRYHDVKGIADIPFTVNGTELKIADAVFKIENSKITGFNQLIGKATLVKIPANNQLAGKTFTGLFYKADGSVLHPRFFYSFDASNNKVAAGFEVGNTLRTENYAPIANMAAYIKNDASQYNEFIVKMPDGSVISNYKDGSGIQYGLLK